LEDDIDDFSNHLTDDNQVNMEQVLAGADDADMIQNCMKKLSGTHREVIHLAFFEDMHYQEIAQVSDCPEGTIKTRVFHAKQALKKCLARLMAAMEPVT
jgi:RNA polymerase sigma-70 factor (ECF subfamily)